MSAAHEAVAAVAFSRDEVALLMMREYSALCAACAHEPSAARFAAADEKREAILRHAAQQEHAIDAAIKALVEAAKRSADTDVTATQSMDNQLTLRMREAFLRSLLGLGS